MWWARVIVASAALLAVGVNSFTWEEPTALDDYVNFDDGFFEWSILDEYRFEENKTTVYMLNMTSQKWMDETFSDRSVWYHMMAVAVPDQLNHDVAFQWIEGGSNGPGTGPAPPTDQLVGMVVEVASKLNAVGAYIRQVPNSRVVFTNDPDQVSKSEDAIIAWTWHTFITTHQDKPEVILRMPMTKSAKRGHDAIQQLLLEKRGRNVNKFISAGGSKRGWTAWSVAATDRRVIATTPCVMSLLNFNDTLQAHYRNMGGAWTWVFSDYYNVNLTRHFHDEIVTKSPGGLWDYEDMFRYKERLGLIPKLLISAAGDEFFLLTDSLTWWDEMPGVKYIEMVPNAEHSLVPWYRKVGETIAGFAWHLLNNDMSGSSLPKMNWLLDKTEAGAFIRLSSDVVPDEITVWEAFTWRNDTRKDYRLAVGYPPFIHPVLWRRSEFEELAPGEYFVERQSPEVGFCGYFFEAVYLVNNNFRLTLTTQANTAPNVYPAPPCYGADCYAYLI